MDTPSHSHTEGSFIADQAQHSIELQRDHSDSEAEDTRSTTKEGQLDLLVQFALELAELTSRAANVQYMMEAIVERLATLQELVERLYRDKRDGTREEVTSDAAEAAREGALPEVDEKSENLDTDLK
ncbi:uncharacterized protein BDZ99DRAFT_513511 [Mytilinidion resinicola]|uniref:Uncharacterized protein n=1 Tax=Mytilinidion resinicola TaxID=574789 RepID=A0A6A6Z8Y6_9PEZI|nr:uncharacterized protein BDZ99DRAFT_513511 [Mytilinidion resinicola]KAF2817268.1 hypothetical protein BDZ99DRAFT_513511 [Mytilinidion resinicola]